MAPATSFCHGFDWLQTHLALNQFVPFYLRLRDNFFPSEATRQLANSCCGQRSYNIVRNRGEKERAPLIIINKEKQTSSKLITDVTNRPMFIVIALEKK